MTKLKHENIKTITTICRLSDKLLVTGHKNGLISIFNAKTGEIVNHWGGQYAQKSEKNYNQTAISSLIRVNDGVVAIGGDDGYLRIKVIDEWGGGRGVTLVTMPGKINHLQLNKAGDIIFSTQCRNKEGANQIAIISSKDYTLKKQYITDDKILGNSSKSTERYPDALLLLPDQRIAFSTYSGDHGGCSVVIWDPEIGTDIILYNDKQKGSRITGLSLNVNKELVAVYASGEMDIWNIERQDLIRSIPKRNKSYNWFNFKMLSNGYFCTDAFESSQNEIVHQFFIAHMDKQGHDWIRINKFLYEGIDSHRIWIKLAEDSLFDIDLDRLKSTPELDDRKLYHYAMGLTYGGGQWPGNYELLSHLAIHRPENISVLCDKSEIDCNQNNALHLAVQNEDHILAKILVQLKSEMLLKKNKENKTPYQLAQEKNHYELIKLFDEQSKYPQSAEFPNQKQYNESLSEREMYEKNELESSLKKANEEIQLLKIMVLEMQGKIKSEKDIFNEALLNACRSGHFKKMESALNFDADIEIKDEKGNTPIFLSLKNRHFACARYLLMNTKADLTVVNKKGETILLYTAKQGDTEAVKMILDNLGKLDSEINLLLSTFEYLSRQLNLKNLEQIKQMIIDKVLHQAAKQGDKDLAEKALKMGANLNNQDKLAWTPLHTACYFGHAAIVTLLLSKNCNINLLTNREQDPMEVACNGEIAQLILHHQEKKATEISAHIKGYLGHRQYLKVREKDHKLLTQESKQLIIKSAEEEKFNQVTQISSALQNLNFHAIRQIKRGNVEVEVPLNKNFKVTY